MEKLLLSTWAGLRASNAGLFISRGKKGIHPDRVMDSHELIFVRKNVLAISEEKREFEIKPGQTLLMWPGRRHRGTRIYPDDLSFYWIHFYLQRRPKGRLDGAESQEIPQVATIRREDRLSDLFHRFLDDQESGALEPLRAALLVRLMLCEIVASSGVRPDRDSAAAALAHRAQQFVETHFHLPISTLDVAGELDCNPDYLGRVFASVHAQTLTEAIHKRRLRHARWLLTETTNNSEQIAAQCGFTDAGYFRRLFRRYQGLTPVAFRKLYARRHVNTE